MLPEPLGRFRRLSQASCRSFRGLSCSRRLHSFCPPSVLRLRFIATGSRARGEAVLSLRVAAATDLIPISRQWPARPDFCSASSPCQLLVCFLDDIVVPPGNSKRWSSQFYLTNCFAPSFRKFQSLGRHNVEAHPKGTHLKDPVTWRVI